MQQVRIVVVAGDGIGPEVTREAQLVLGRQEDAARCYRRARSLAGALHQHHPLVKRRVAGRRQQHVYTPSSNCRRQRE